MIYYCKYFLRRDGLKSNCHYLKMELSSDLYPLTQKLVSCIEKMEDPGSDILKQFQNIDEKMRSYYNVEYCISKVTMAKTAASKEGFGSVDGCGGGGSSRDKKKKSFFPIFFDTSN